MPPTSGSPNPPAANPEVALDHHNAKVCHFFKLPRELRDMIWDLTTRNNIYISRHHLGAKITPIPYPASTQSPTKHGLINTPTLPSTLCRGQMINKLIFDESLPILSRNTEFSFHQPSDFEALVWQYKPIRRHITAIRIHDGERYTMRMEVHFAFSINSCPNLSKVSYFVQPDALRTWDSDPQVHPLDAVAKILPIGQLERMRGVREFRLFFVDSPDFKPLESMRRFFEEELGLMVAKPRGPETKVSEEKCAAVLRFLQERERRARLARTLWPRY